MKNVLAVSKHWNFQDRVGLKLTSCRSFGKLRLVGKKLFWDPWETWKNGYRSSHRQLLQFLGKQKTAKLINVIFENSSPHRHFWGKNRNTKFRFCRRILDISGQWLLNSLKQDPERYRLYLEKEKKQKKKGGEKD